MIRVLSRRERVILYLTAGLIIFALFYNLLLAPVLDRNGELNGEIKRTRVKLSRYMRLLSQKESIQERYIKLNAAAGATDQPAGILVSALSELEGLAKNTQIRIIDIRPSTSTSSTPRREILIDLRTEGTMEGYLRFIYDIENSLSLLRIRKLQLNAKPNTPILEGSFVISQFSVAE